ncbi:hypothetical protein L7F22_010348 [Adiantum nelumboides]|nr:hypothetical protein [Adiantum nelumboides]
MHLTPPIKPPSSLSLAHLCFLEVKLKMVQPQSHLPRLPQMRSRDDISLVTDRETKDIEADKNKSSESISMQAEKQGDSSPQEEQKAHGLEQKQENSIATLQMNEPQSENKNDTATNANLNDPNKSTSEQSAGENSHPPTLSPCVIRFFTFIMSSDDDVGPSNRNSYLLAKILCPCNQCKHAVQRTRCVSLQHVRKFGEFDASIIDQVVATYNSSYSNAVQQATILQPNKRVRGRFSQAAYVRPQQAVSHSLEGDHGDHHSNEAMFELEIDEMFETIMDSKMLIYDDMKSKADTLLYDGARVSRLKGSWFFSTCRQSLDRVTLASQRFSGDVIFHPTKSASNWWYVIEVAPRSARTYEGYHVPITTASVEEIKEDIAESEAAERRRWYAQRHHSGAPLHRSTPSTSTSISEHSLRSEGLVSTRQSTHSSRHRCSSGGRGGCYGDAATDASTPPRSRQGFLPSPSLTTPAMAFPSTPCFVGYTPLATSLGVTLIDTPCFKAQTLVEIPIETPLNMPLETPTETPRFTRHRREGLSYSIDLSGGIILDEDGKKVVLRMRSLCSQLFRHYILNTWSEVPSELKDTIISMLHDEFRVSCRDERFNEDLMKNPIDTLIGRDETSD